MAGGRPLSLRRELGRFDATMVVVGGIIGAGIFINPTLVAQRLPTGGLVLAAWAAGGLIAAAGAFAFAELAALFPKAGGEYVYLREAWHPLIGFLCGWASLLLIQGGGLAAVAITFAQYALRLAGRNPEGAVLPLAVASVLVVALVNAAGVKPGSRLLNVLVVAKLAALAVLIGAGWIFGPGGPATGPAAHAATQGTSLLAFGAALMPVLFAYGGWQSVNIVAEEIREPRRALPFALVVGIAIVVFIYLSANIVYLQTLGRDGLAATMTPAADAVRRFGGPWADRFVTGAIAVSAFGFLDLTLLAAPRITYAMARDGLLSPGLSRLHEQYQTPARAIALQAGWAVVLLLTGTFQQLVATVVLADWIFFGLTVAGLFVFHRRLPPASREPGSFRTPGYPVVPAIFVAASVLVVVSTVWSDPRRALYETLLLGSGVPAYLFFARRAKA
jgi:APA family basic amino acid/polyamine antiporter